MQLGNVRWYDANRGIGLIDGDDGSIVFLPFHAIAGTDITRFEIPAHQRVQFEVEHTGHDYGGITGGLRATWMQLVGAPPSDDDVDQD